jgi:isocitrate/isopropylmalate dehydrogenase
VTLRLVALPGDGAGPELLQAVRTVLDATDLDVEHVTLDHRRTPVDGIVAEIRAAGAALKGPLATPQDGTASSLNVVLRRELGLHTQIRRTRSVPGTGTPDADVRVVRQTTEGLFAGLGFDAGTDGARALSRLTGGLLPSDAAVSLKFATEAATRRTVEVACDVAAAIGCRTLVVAHKAAAVPHADGHFLRTAEAVVAERRDRGGDLRVRALAVDAAAARLVSHAGELPLIVTSNLYGDILSDVAGAAAGSVALTAGANVGDGVATFEAAHGAVWRHARADTANPLGLLLSAVMLLDHVGETVTARRVEEAVLTTLDDGIATADLHPETMVGTQRFAAEVADRLA